MPQLRRFAADAKAHLDSLRTAIAAVDVVQIAIGKRPVDEQQGAIAVSLAVLDVRRDSELCQRDVQGLPGEGFALAETMPSAALAPHLGRELGKLARVIGEARRIGRPGADDDRTVGDELGQALEHRQ